MPEPEQKTFFKIYQKHLYFLGIKLDSKKWILLSLIASLALSAASVFLLFVLRPGFDILLIFPFIVFILLIDVFIGIPYNLALRKVDAFEKHFADALKQIADVLQSGGTYSLAIEEVVEADYPLVSNAFEKVLRRLDEGQTFRDALRTLTEEVPSKNIERLVDLIVELSLSGAKLSDVLDDMADDFREIKEIENERKSRTLMQYLFLASGSAVIAPFIFSLVVAIINIMYKVLSQIVAVPEQAMANIVFLSLIFEFYILAEIIFSSFMMSYIRDGDYKRGFLILPFLLLIAFAIFFLGKFLVLRFISV